MDKYLLGTHVMIWFFEGNRKLNSKIIEIIENKPNNVIISIVSFWGNTIKISKNKLKLNYSIDRLFELVSKNLPLMAILLTVAIYSSETLFIL